MAEYSTPSRLTSSAGDLLLNPGVGLPGIHLTGLPGLDDSEIRAPVENKPQGDGGIWHRFFKGPIRFSMEGVILANTLSAREAYITSLKHHLNRMRLSDGRYRWTPSTGGDDLFVTCKKDQPLTINGSNVKSFSVGLVAIDPTIYSYTQITSNFSGSATLTNLGNEYSWPVLKVYGSGTFSLSNTSYSPAQTISAVGMPLGGGYVEIVPRLGTAFLNGTGANMTQYLTMESLQYWSLAPGANSITISGGTVDILWNHGWT